VEEVQEGGIADLTHSPTQETRGGHEAW
jgi:hypothetical protein